MRLEGKKEKEKGGVINTCRGELEDACLLCFMSGDMFITSDSV